MSQKFSVTHSILSNFLLFLHSQTRSIFEFLLTPYKQLIRILPMKFLSIVSFLCLFVAMTNKQPAASNRFFECLRQKWMQESRKSEAFKGDRSGYRSGQLIEVLSECNKMEALKSPINKEYFIYYPPQLDTFYWLKVEKWQYASVAKSDSAFQALSNTEFCRFQSKLKVSVDWIFVKDADEIIFIETSHERFNSEQLRLINEGIDSCPEGYHPITYLRYYH